MLPLSKEKSRKRTFSPQSVQFLDSTIGNRTQLYLFVRFFIDNGCYLVAFRLYLQPNRLIMGQTAFTVRMDSEVKKQFDELCRDFGMSSNTAFNVFAKTVIKKQCIPFEVVFITLTFLGIFPMHQGIGLLGDKSRRTGLFVFHLPRLPLAMPACLLGAWANPSFYPRSNNQRAVSLTLINSLIKQYLPAASNIT